MYTDCNTLQRSQLKRTSAQSERSYTDMLERVGWDQDTRLLSGAFTRWSVTLCSDTFTGWAKKQTRKCTPVGSVNEATLKLSSHFLTNVLSTDIQAQDAHSNGRLGY